MKTTNNSLKKLLLVSILILSSSSLFSANDSAAEEKDYTFLITVLAGSIAFIAMFSAKIWYDRKEEKQRELELKNRRAMNKNRPMKNFGTSAG
jgi:nitric oxide reductase large subunit